MNYNNSIKIAEIRIEDKEYEVRMTEHSALRMIDRGIDKFVVTGSIIALGKRINQIEENGYDEGIVIDKPHNVAVIFAIFKDKYTCKSIVKIITVINRANVFVKENTKIFNV